MKALAIQGKIIKESEKFIIIPATKADGTNLDLYTTQLDGKYSTITMKSGYATKSYSQVKTAWAIIKMLAIARLGRKPTEQELNQVYEECLDLFADKELIKGIFSDDKYEPISMSKMSKSQLARFIQSMMQFLHETTNGLMISPDDMIEIDDLFKEWKNYLSLLDVDPTDLDENGEYLSLDDYRKIHTVSYASGRACGEDGSPLEMAHIVSKGSDPAFENCCWNVMMLTHEEHQGIMHGHEIHEGGWNALIARFPHIRGRVERAYNMAHHLYKIMDQEGIEAL